MYNPKVLAILGLVGAGIVVAALCGSAKPATPAPVVAAVAESALPMPPELNPSALTYKTADQIPWKESPNGSSASFVAYGDPTKPGLYVQFIKWHSHMVVGRISIPMTASFTSSRARGR